MQSRLIAPLTALGEPDLALVGGKGANLGELVKNGFPVPDGFIVTTEVYRTIVETTGLDLRIKERVTATRDDDSSIRTELESLTIPEEIREAIIEAYAKLGRRAVAVRSSATSEDLPGATFAGQQDTYLNVVGEEEVLDAVRRCWGSLWTDRAIAYRGKRGIDSRDVRMAVIVQNMVHAEAAGVLFTANPVTGHRNQMVVDASPGLGEAVVSGLVTPDHYVLDATGRLLKWSPGRSEVVITPMAGGGLSHETGTSTQERVMSDETLGELARFGCRIADHFRRPQDIEWAYADGRLWLLQARPMTALPPPPLRLNRIQRTLGSVFLELLSVRPYPIDMSTWVPHGPASMMAKVTNHFGIRGAFEDFLEEEEGVVYRFLPPSPRPTLGLLRAPFRIASLARRYDPRRWTHDRRLQEYIARTADLGAQDVTIMPWSRLTRVPRQALELIQPMAELRICYLPRAGLLLLRLLLVLKLLRRASLLGDLIVGAKTRTGDLNRSLEELAQTVRANPPLRAAIDGLDPESLRPFGDFKSAFDAFLDEYGHRETATALLATPPTWGESPETALGLIKVLASTPPESKPEERSAQTLERLLTHPLLRSQGMQTLLRRWVEAARGSVAFREDTHFYFTKPLPILRRSLLEIGRRLRNAGIVDEPEDVFHLRLEELERIDDIDQLSEGDAQALSRSVRKRSAKRDELHGVPLIDPRSIFPSRHDDGTDALVSGTPAGAGTATGPVCVIREPAEFAKLKRGDILVCPYTNPAWTPLFQRAAAVVVDSGALGSHAAIVAREYGIPAIMGTAVGSTALEDGQMVTVDGSTGRVTPA